MTAPVVPLEAPPSGAPGSGVRCSRCNVTLPAGTTCAGWGAFLPGNEANLRSGVRRFQTTGRLPDDLKVSVDEFLDMVVSDQGGLDELSAIRAGLVRLLRGAEIGSRLCMNHVVVRGYDSRPGRAAY